jgi:hypothetical protein
LTRRRTHVRRCIMGFISEILGRLWRSANFWRVSPIEGVRTGSKLAGGLMFLFMLFTLIGVLLLMFGFDLDQVDRWLDAQGGWLDLVGSIAFRGLIWFIFLMCVVLILGWAFDRKNPDRPGWGMALGAAIVAWFCSASLFAPL